MTSQLTGNTQALLSEQRKRRRQRKPSLQQIMQLSVLNNVSQIGDVYIIILGAKRKEKAKYEFNFKISLNHLQNYVEQYRVALEDIKKLCI